jgi:hypothetical protein
MGDMFATIAASVMHERWWVLSETEFIVALQRASKGERVGSIVQDFYANAESEAPTVTVFEK